MNRHTQPANLRDIGAGLERLCLGCGQWLPYTEANFHRSRANASGLVCRCKRCLCTAQTVRNRTLSLGQRTTYHAHADDGAYWQRYRSRNARKARLTDQ